MILKSNFLRDVNSSRKKYMNGLFEYERRQFPLRSIERPLSMNSKGGMSPWGRLLLRSSLIAAFSRYLDCATLLDLG